MNYPLSREVKGRYVRFFGECMQPSSYGITPKMFKTVLDCETAQAMLAAGLPLLSALTIEEIQFYHRMSIRATPTSSTI